MSLPTNCGAITLQYTKKCVYHTVVKGTPVLTKSGGHVTSQIPTSIYRHNLILSAVLIYRKGEKYIVLVDFTRRVAKNG